jgi:predicted nucleic acid-binding protein
MKNLFSWRLPLSDSDFSSLWENATFVFDTNFLLDLYRGSRSRTEDFLKILEKIQDRVWLPYQVADEFFNRREEVIDKEKASFQEAKSLLKKWKDDLHSFNALKGKLEQSGRIVLSEVESLYDEQTAYFDAVNRVEEAFLERIEQLTDEHSFLNAEEDSILDRLHVLFNAKIGDPIDEKTLQSRYKEAEDRYKQSKPPGFMDSKKDGNRKYGDYLIWREILDFAKKESCPIIFVTGDKKEDWWNKKKGEITSPHTGLRREFQEDVKQLFWMYQPARFLEIARDRFNVEIDLRSIEETDAISDAELIDEQERQLRNEQEHIPELQALESLKRDVPGSLPWDKIGNFGQTNIPNFDGSYLTLVDKLRMDEAERSSWIEKMAKAEAERFSWIEKMAKAEAEKFSWAEKMAKMYGFTRP